MPDERTTSLPSGRLASIQADPGDSAGAQLLIDGAAQSYVYPGEPLRLFHDYVQRMANVVARLAEARPRARVLHVGAGALTLPRWVAVAHPRMAQQVIDSEAGLVEFVARTLPGVGLMDLPVTVGDADDAVVRLAQDGQHFDVVLHDVYVGLTPPPHLVSGTHLMHLSGVLTPGGVLALNVADDLGTPLTRTLAGMLSDRFSHVLVSAPGHVLDARTPGNTVLIASDCAEVLDWIPSLQAAGPHPGRVVPCDLWRE